MNSSLESIDTSWGWEIGIAQASYLLQCPHSEEEHSVATICGFEEEFNDMRVKTC